MDLRAFPSVCAPILGSKRSLPLLGCGWRSSQIHGNLDAALVSSLCVSQISKQKKDTRVFACIYPALESAPVDESLCSGRPIRTLLIDNYDSYTYNLYQFLCVINGAPPLVIKNDEVSWEDLRKLLRKENAFDNIVISPGPGSPMCAEDIGVCQQVLQECVDIPILGVCLGHQVLGYVNGAKVVHAPEPVHGRLSEVEHIGCPLFKDIPSGRGSGFQVVRYHSLMLDINTFPEDLIPTAWSANSCRSLSLEAPLLNELELAAASNFGNPSVVSDEVNGRGVHLCEEAKHDPKIGSGNGFTWECNPCRVQRSAGNGAVSNSVPHIHTGINTSNLAENNNVLNGSMADGENEARLIMGVSHKKRPHYGVQFHPESVATSYGAQILKNFRDITSAYWKEKGMTMNAGAGARFSFMGTKGGRLWKRLTYSLPDKHGSGVLKIEDEKSVEEIQLENGFLEFLSSDLESYTTSKADSEGLPFDFWGGYVGYLGYELKAECGARFNQHKSKIPDACYFFVDQFIAVDHSNNDVYAVGLYKETPNTQMENLLVNIKSVEVNAPSSISKHTSSLLDTRSARLSAQGWVKDTLKKVHELAVGDRDMSVESNYLLQPASYSLGTIDRNSDFIIQKSKKQYMDDVKACLEYIRDGESYELCLTTQMEKRVNSLDALGLYLTLRKMNPAPYAAWLNFGTEEVCICSSSPERFLKLDQNGVIEAKPIKGTRPRGRSPAEDEALKSNLQYSEKDRAENLMIVDLLRNDIGRVCEPGSVHVPKLMAIESYSTVHTMVSTVRGLKRYDVPSVDCVRASFPGGSMTGAPKLRSMELLDSLECTARGVYSGSIGFFSVNSAFDLNIVIRTLVIHKGVVSIGAGGAIVALSDPADEYEEMRLKTKAPIMAVSQHETLIRV